MGGRPARKMLLHLDIGLDLEQRTSAWTTGFWNRSNFLEIHSNHWENLKKTGTVRCVPWRLTQSFWNVSVWNTFPVTLWRVSIEAHVPWLTCVTCLFQAHGTTPDRLAILACVPGRNYVTIWNRWHARKQAGPWQSETRGTICRPTASATQWHKCSTRSGTFVLSRSD